MTSSYPVDRILSLLVSPGKWSGSRQFWSKGNKRNERCACTKLFDWCT